MICILGATALGKTRVAVNVARALDGEIISADSRQVYRRMDIGTGKDLSEYKEGGAVVPCHLLNIAEPGDEFNVFEFQKTFLRAYKLIKKSGRLPIMCGGTGLYLDSVINRYDLVEVARDDSLRNELNEKTTDELVAKLVELKPLHNVTDVLDRNRLIRAIEIAFHSNNDVAKFEEFPEIKTCVFGMRTERPILKKRIDERLKSRLAHGMIDEVNGLLKEGLLPKQIEFYGLEYRFVTKYITGEIRYNDMYQKLREAIYQFARRQEKWFRRMERKGTVIEWLDAEKPICEMVDFIVKRVKCCE